MDIRNALAELYYGEELLFADGFDEAVIGVCRDTYRVIYDANKMIDILIKDDDMSYEDAIEFLEFNTFYTYVGDKTPIYCNVIKYEDERIF